MRYARDFCLYNTLPHHEQDVVEGEQVESAFETVTDTLIRILFWKAPRRSTRMDLQPPLPAVSRFTFAAPGVLLVYRDLYSLLFGEGF